MTNPSSLSVSHSPSYKSKSNLEVQEERSPNVSNTSNVNVESTESFTGYQEVPEEEDTPGSPTFVTKDTTPSPSVTKTTSKPLSVGTGRQTDKLVHALVPFTATLAVVVFGSLLGTAFMIQELREFIMPEEVRQYIKTGGAIAPPDLPILCTEDLQEEYAKVENKTLSKQQEHIDQHIKNYDSGDYMVEKNKQAIAKINKYVKKDQKYNFKNNPNVNMTGQVYFTAGFKDHQGNQPWFTGSITGYYQCGGNACNPFECVEPGVYLFEASIMNHRKVLTEPVGINLVHKPKGGNAENKLGLYIPGGGSSDEEWAASNSAILKLAFGDTVSLKTSTGNIRSLEYLSSGDYVTTLTAAILFGDSPKKMDTPNYYR